MGWLIAYGAVVRREVLVYLRRKQIFVAVLILSLILMGALLLSWPDESYGWWAAQSLSYAVFMNTQILLLFAAMGLTPAIAAGMIAGERERNTWDLCAASPMPVSALVAGKWTASIVLIGVLFVALAPFVAALFFLIGVDIVQILLTGAVVAVSAATCAIAAIAASVGMRRSSGAMVVAYAFSLFVVIGFPVLWALLEMLEVEFGFLVSIPDPTQTAISGLSPLFLLITISSGALLRGAIPVFAIGMAIIALTFWSYVVYRLRRPAEFSPIPDEVPARRWWRRTKRKKRPAAISRTFPDNRNPIFLRESTWGLPLGARGHWRTFLRMAFASAGVALVFGYALGVNNVDAWQIISLVNGILALGVAFLLPPILAGLFPRELERNTAVCATMSLMTNADMARGKCRTAALRVIAILAAPLITLTVMWLIWNNGKGANPALYRGASSLVSGAIVAYALTMIASIRSRTTTGAVLGGFALIGFAAIGGPMMAGLLLGASGVVQGEEFAILCSIISPALNYIVAVVQIDEGFKLGFLTYFNCLLHVTVALAWLSWEMRRFRYRLDRTVGG